MSALLCPTQPTERRPIGDGAIPTEPLKEGVAAVAQRDEVCQPVRFSIVGDSIETKGLRNGRRAIGVELKPSYFRVAAENCRKAEYESELPSLFDEVGAG